MNILGIETSCDECSVAVVAEGKTILSNIVASQVEQHAPWNGVVPEIASRLHIEWIDEVTSRALIASDLSLKAGINGIAVTYRPGLIGSLLVGLSYAKGLAWTAGKPWIGVDHIMAHLYAVHLENEIAYPHLGLIVSGGHTILCRVESIDEVSILGATIDDACGEAFDKVAKHYEMGYPGGVKLDALAENGDPGAFNFPQPRLGARRYDFSYSGLKTAAINQLEKFRTRRAEASSANIAASFRKAAIDMLISRLKLAAEYTGINRVVFGGGVSANRYLRRVVDEDPSLEAYFPSLALCVDNGAMVAGLGYHLLLKGKRSPLELNAQARVSKFRRSYP